MNHKHRAIGLVTAVAIIFLAGILSMGFFGRIGYGILFGPLFLAALEYRQYKKTTVILVNDHGGELILSGETSGHVGELIDMGWKLK